MTERTGQAYEAGTIDRLMAGWVADVETPDACAAHLLCDRWPADAVAFRFVAEDMSAVDLTFGELADRSRRLATGLAARHVGGADGVEQARLAVVDVTDGADVDVRLGALELTLGHGCVSMR